MVEFLHPNDSWERIIEVTSKNLAAAMKVVAENKCNKPKDIGDRVIVWDGSYSEDIETGKKYYGIDEIFKHPMIIIEKDCVNEYPDPIIKRKTNRDIVVYSPKYKRKIATCMDCVKLVE